MSGVATNMSDDFTYLGYTDEVHTKLDSIEQRLLQLGEELLLSERSEEPYAFAVHDALSALPLLGGPAHFRVMKRITRYAYGVGAGS